jgi:hypothetical protein
LNKKAFIVIPILLAAALTMAVSCLPLAFLEQYLLPGQPVDPLPGDGPSNVDPADPIAACAGGLGDLLWEAENDDLPGAGLELEVTLATYVVSGDSITAPDLPPVPEDLEAYQQDASLHQEIWAFIVEVVPAEYRTNVAYFMVFTDGPAGTLGAVEQTADPEAWMLEMDVQDAGDLPALATTLVHEIAHVFTLNTSQVATDLAVFNDPEDDTAYAEGDAACDTYFMFEGCSTPDSYINQFFARYWGELYPGWLELNQEQDETTLENLLSDFYGRHPGQFVSSYAVTSPEEDIAESFLYFVLSPPPAGDTIAEEKILFFYEFPELVILRDRMRASLCPYIMP